MSFGSLCPSPQSPAGHLQGCDSCCQPESQDQTGNLWTLVPKSSLRQALLAASGRSLPRPPLRPLLLVPPGEILVQMSDTQRHLNSDLEVVVSLSLEGHSGERAAFHGGRGPHLHTLSQRGLWGDGNSSCPLGPLPGPGSAGYSHLPILLSSSTLGGRCHVYGL